MKVYCFSGLGADKRVFQELNLDLELIHIEWKPVNKSAPIESYALLLSREIDNANDHIIIGVSFGGLIAMEVSKITKPNLTILISSAEVRTELKWTHRTTGKLRLTQLTPSFLIKPPTWILAWMFGTRRKKLLKAIIKDSDPQFLKWAIHALCTWKNETRGGSVLKISGDRDKLMRINENAEIIKDGHHLLIMDRAKEVSLIINDEIKKL